MAAVNDFVLNVATANGSGSQSSNTVLVKSLFRMGLPVVGKNLFPSNIAGLPTWFSIRVSEQGWLSRRAQNEIVIAMNQATLSDDIKNVKSGGVFLYNSDFKVDPILLRSDVTNLGIPFRSIVSEVTDSIKLKKLLTNMVYVGVIAECLGIDPNVVSQVVADQFRLKPEVIEINQKALDAGSAYAHSEGLSDSFPFAVKAILNGNKGKILIDGNSAAALGSLFGGCSFLSWYPITPSSSLAESFQHFAQLYRKDEHGNNTYCVVQAEDELSAIAMVAGAGWAGARSMTATSGPGLSLMAEAAGLSYFAEIPAVIWDVQRAGPSTGLPTRTMQGDVLAAAHLSHGDTRQVLLFPATPEECFDFGQVAFDLAERLQTLVIVLSDLDLGMNLWISDEFHVPDKPFDRGKVLDAEALKQRTHFARYEDVDDDGIPYRTLPGTHHPLAPYFTRGTGHDPKALYSEDNTNYRELLDRLNKKFETAKKLMPAPQIISGNEKKIGVIAYGSSHPAVLEALQLLKNNGVEASYLRVKAFPFTDKIKSFIDEHEHIYVVEQNRDAQLLTLLRSDIEASAGKYRSVLQYDGLPLEGHFVSQQVLQQEGLV